PRDRPVLAGLLVRRLQGGDLRARDDQPASDARDLRGRPGDRPPPGLRAPLADGRGDEPLLPALLPARGGQRVLFRHVGGPGRGGARRGALRAVGVARAAVGGLMPPLVPAAPVGLPAGPPGLLAARVRRARNAEDGLTGEPPRA